MNIVYHVDCMEYMKTLPDKFFDLAVVDPPYGIGINSMTFTKEGSERKFGHSACAKRDYKGKGEWDKKPSKKYFDELMRVSRHQIIWGGNYFTDILPPCKGFLIWDKRCSEAMSNAFADCEMAWMSKGMGVARVFRYVWSGMIQGNMKNKEDRFHPTQKPVALYEWIYRLFAKHGDKILDTHLGSGSSRIAAYDAGLDFVGCEINDYYFVEQERRFKEHTAQANMFVKDEHFEQISLFEGGEKKNGRK